MLWGRREMFTVTQHAGLGLAKHLLDWAGVHTGHSAEAAVTIAAEAVAAVEAAAGVAVAGPVAEVVVAAAVVAAAELVAHSEFAAAAVVVAQAGSGSIAASQRAAGNSCCSWWRWRGRRRGFERQRGVSSRAAEASESGQWTGARATACRRDGVVGVV